MVDVRTVAALLVAQRSTLFILQGQPPPHENPRQTQLIRPRMSSDVFYPFPLCRLQARVYTSGASTQEVSTLAQRRASIALHCRMQGYS